MIRDTDRDWQHIGENHPYYGVLSNERFLHPSDEALTDFFATGRQDIDHIVSTFKRIFGDFAPASALDFGCGVGRQLIPVAQVAGFAYGVDIADSMLELAAKHARVAEVRFELGKSIPEERQFDWVNTAIVLQHIPPSRGYPIIRRLWRCLASDGYLSMHVTAFKDSRHQGEVLRDFKLFRCDGESLINFTADEDDSLGMSMFDYDLNRVFSCLDLPDGCGVYMEKTDHGGCHGFRIYIKKK